MKKDKWIDGLTISSEQKVIVNYNCSKIMEITFD